MAITDYYVVPEDPYARTAKSVDFARWLEANDIRALSKLSEQEGQGVTLVAPDGAKLYAEPGDMVLIDDGIVRFATMNEQAQIEAQTTPPAPVEYEVVIVTPDASTRHIIITADHVDIAEGFVMFRLEGVLVLAIQSERVLEFNVEGAQDDTIRDANQGALFEIGGAAGPAKKNPYVL